MRIKVDIKSAIGIVILILLALTPIFNIGEIYSVISGKTCLSDYLFALKIPVQTPVYIKLIKDAGFLIICILSAFNLRKLERYKLKLFFLTFLPLLVATIILFIPSYRHNPIQALSGLRWIEPLFLAAFLIGNIDDRLMTNIAKVVSVVFLISFVVQIYEQFKIRPLYTGPLDFRSLLKYYWTDHVWVSGVFIIYHVAGLFSCLTLFFTYFYLKIPKLRILILCLIPVNILLTSAGTALPTYLAANYLIFMKGKFRSILTIGFVFLIIITTLALPKIINRPGIVNGNLVNGRIEVLKKSFCQSGLISDSFGKGTNSMVAYSMKYGGSGGQIMDSTLLGIVINVGSIGFVAVIVAYLIWLVLVLISGRPEALIFTVIFSLFSVTTPITEAFPGNLLFAVGLGYFIPIIFRKKEKCVVA